MKRKHEMGNFSTSGFPGSSVRTATSQLYENTGSSQPIKTTSLLKFQRINDDL